MGTRNFQVSRHRICPISTSKPRALAKHAQGLVAKVVQGGVCAWSVREIDAVALVARLTAALGCP